jgi:hypothetical protein
LLYSTVRKKAMDIIFHTIKVGNGGLELEWRIVGAMSDLTAWAICHKLTISASKTVCMVMKG